MQRQRDGELVPIAEVVADLGGSVQALRETPPPAQRGFTLADQVHQLVGASEADAETEASWRELMALCSPAPQQPRQPASVCPDATAPTRWDYVLKRASVHKLPYRESTAPVAGLGVYRSRADPKPRAG